MLTFPPSVRVFVATDEQEHELHCCGGEENDDDELDSAHGP